MERLVHDVYKMRDKMKVVVIIVVVAMPREDFGRHCYFFGGSQQVPAEAVVATVNGQDVTAWDLYQIFMNQLQQIEAQQGAHQVEPCAVRYRFGLISWRFSPNQRSQVVI